MSMDLGSFGVGFMGVNGMSGGERVRLCNPCVPDPNTAPPQTAAGAQRYRTTLTSRERYQRSRRSIGDVYLGAPSQSHDTFQTFAARNRATSMVSTQSRTYATVNPCIDTRSNTNLDMLYQVRHRLVTELVAAPILRWR